MKYPTRSSNTRGFIGFSGSFTMLWCTTMVALPGRICPPPMITGCGAWFCPGMGACRVNVREASVSMFCG